MKKHRSVETDTDSAPASEFTDDTTDSAERSIEPQISDSSENNFDDTEHEEMIQSSNSNGDFSFRGSGRQTRNQGRPFCWFCWLTLILLLAAIIAAYSFVNNWRLVNYEDYKSWICENLLDNECDYEPVIIISQQGDRILTEDSVLSDWIKNVRPHIFLENKFRSLSINYSVFGSEEETEFGSDTGNVLLGLYERDALKRPVEAATHFLLAGVNGDLDAREIFRNLKLDQAERSDAQRYLEEVFKLNGAEGYFKLGQLYLGNDASDETPGDYPTSNRPKYNLHRNLVGLDNDFLVNEPDYSVAYRHMYVAVQCNWPGSYEWLGYISNLGSLEGRRQSLNREAQDEINERVNFFRGDLEAFCKGDTLSDRVEQLRSADVIELYIENRRAWPTFRELIESLQLSQPEFCQLYGITNCLASGPYRPPYSVNRPFDTGRRIGSQEGVPAECVDLAPGEQCEATARIRVADARCEERAMSAYNTGRALISRNPQQARANLEIAIETGKECQAEGSRRAATLMQRLNMTCTYSTQSLARISRNAENNPEGGAVISLRARQSALTALRYYNYNIDGKYGPQTRDAVSSFQREFGFVDTGALTPEETVHLFCIAGVQRGDVRSEHTLGLMYVTGLGVIRDMDAGIRHLENTSSFGYAASTYNLALIYGTGTVAASYQLCDVPENLQRADSYLEEAANAGHPGANQLIRDFGSLLVSERWQKIKERLELDEFHQRRMSTVGEGCTPNP